MVKEDTELEEYTKEVEERNNCLDELKLYIGVELSLMKSPLDRHKIEGILERTVKALEVGATPQQIKEVFREYVSAYKPDRTYG